VIVIRGGLRLPELHDGLAQIRLESANRSMLEARNAPERSDERILDDVFGIGVAARVARQPPSRPTAD